MNDGLIDALRHNTWASRRLLATLAPLSDAQWDTTALGTYGTIRATFWHILAAEGRYCGRLTGERPVWANSATPPTDTATLAACLDDLDGRWEHFLSNPFDAEQRYLMDGEDGHLRSVPAGVVLAQVFHHGSEHRSQIATILTHLGVPVPDWGVWEYSEDTDRAPRHIKPSAAQA